MIRFDTVPTVELSTQDNLTEVFVFYDDEDGRHYRSEGLAWTTERVPMLRYHSGESDTLGRAFRVMADRVDPFGRDRLFAEPEINRPRRRGYR